MTTKKLAAFTANMTYDTLSPVSADMAKKCMLDWFGVAIRGSQEKPAQIIRKSILRGGNDEAHVLGEKNLKTTVFDAAFCNGAASHTLDFDDLHNPSIIHLATVVIPGVFAIAEKEHKTGKQMIAAVCAGYEAGGRVGESVIPESYFYWHTTGTAGTFGAAAAAANLLGLDEQQTLMCYGSAGTQAAGLWEFLKEGAMSKALHAGKSSYAGVLSAYLAKNGFTGASAILEGEKGFCHAMTSNPHLELLTENLDSKALKIDQNSFKPYPCCKHSHAAIYAAEVLKNKYKISSSDITEVEIHVNDITDYLINNCFPQNPYGCKFSIQYCVSVMLHFGAVAIEHFAEDMINRQDIRSLMNRVKVIKSVEMEGLYQKDATKLASKVVIKCANGESYMMTVEYPKGDPDNPFSWDDARKKFILLAESVYGQEKAEKLFNLIKNLDECTDFQKAFTECLESDGL